MIITELSAFVYWAYVFILILYLSQNFIYPTIDHVKYGWCKDALRCGQFLILCKVIMVYGRCILSADPIDIFLHCMRSILKKYKLILSFTSSLNTIFGLKWKISEITRRFMLDIFLYFKANHCFSWWVVVNAVGLLDVESTCWAARQKTGGRAPTKIHIATLHIPMDFLVQIRIELYYIYSEQDPYYNCTIIHRKLIT